MGSIPKEIEELKYLLKIYIFFALVSRKSAVLSSATQHAMPPEFGKKWGTECLTLGSLCLPCCMRDTPWSWFILFIIFIFHVLKYCWNDRHFIMAFKYFHTHLYKCQLTFGIQLKLIESQIWQILHFIVWFFKSFQGAKVIIHLLYF